MTDQSVTTQMLSSTIKIEYCIMYLRSFSIPSGRMCVAADHDIEGFSIGFEIGSGTVFYEAFSGAKRVATDRNANTKKAKIRREFRSHRPI